MRRYESYHSPTLLRHTRHELANQIVDVKALSKNELQITLKSAYYPFLQELALPRPFRFIAPSQFKNHEYDKTRQRRIRHLRTTAGCGVNALSGLQNRLFR